MACDNCKHEFTHDNYPVTLLCGHNLCSSCVRNSTKHNYVCIHDEIKQNLQQNPNVDYLNLLELVKSIPELYKQNKFEVSSSQGKFYSKALPQTPKKNQIICKFYVKGSCRYGSNCWFLHKKY